METANVQVSPDGKRILVLQSPGVDVEIRDSLPPPDLSPEEHIRWRGSFGRVCVRGVSNLAVLDSRVMLLHANIVERWERNRFDARGCENYFREGVGTAYSAEGEVVIDRESLMREVVTLRAVLAKERRRLLPRLRGRRR